MDDYVTWCRLSVGLLEAVFPHIPTFIKDHEDYRQELKYRFETIRNGYFTMAKRKQNTELATFDYKKVKWTDVPVTDAQWDEFDDLDKHADWLLDGMLNLLTDGWKLTASADANFETFRFSAICLANGSHNLNYGLSAFSDNPKEAMAILLFKLFVIAQYNLTTYGGGSGKSNRG